MPGGPSLLVGWYLAARVTSTQAGPFLLPSDTVATELPGGVAGSERRDAAPGRPLISQERVQSQEKVRPRHGLRKALAKIRSEQMN